MAVVVALGISNAEVNDDFLREVAAGLKELNEDFPESVDSKEALIAARKFVESYSATKEA